MSRDTRPTRQPETAEYIQKIIPSTLDQSITYAGSIEFNFAQHTNEKGYVFPIPGVKTNQQLTYKIQSNAPLPFSAGDIIRFDRDDKRRYTIDTVSTSALEDNNYRRTFLYPTDEDDVKFKIITLS